MNRIAALPAILGVILALALGAFLWNWMGEDPTRANIVRGAGTVVFGIAMIALAVLYWRKGRS